MRDILYIGQSQDQSGERASNTFKSHFIYQNKNHPIQLYSDVRNLTVRIAACEKDFLDSLEKLLIVAHEPRFNNQHCRSDLSPARGEIDKVKPTVLINNGSIGLLLPCIVDIYYMSKWWIKTNQNQLSDQPQKI